MRWYHPLAYFFGGIFVSNAVPHLTQGMSGHPFQSPFASPPGEGLSSALVNVCWAFGNLFIAYLLIYRVGTFDICKSQHALPLGVGILAIGLLCARSFARFYGGV